MSGPFEQAWTLLKNVMDYGEIADELDEPNPLDVALARARNQGPAPGANLKRLPPATMQDMDRMLQQRRGQTPLGQPVPRPTPPQPASLSEDEIRELMEFRTGGSGGMPPNLPPRKPIPIAGADDGVEPIIHFDTKQHSAGS